MSACAATLFDLSGKVAVITGSSRGIGRAIAAEMVRHGARVVITSRKADACDATAAALNDEFGAGSATAIPANISDNTALEELVRRARAELGPIHVLVCNAATNVHFGLLSDIDDQVFAKILHNNIIANNRLAALCAPDMAALGEGAIILVSSIGGIRASRNIGAYNVSKAADFQLARGLALELGPQNIRVNCIAPGLVRTDFARALWEDPERLRAAEEKAPLRRIGEPEDIAGAAVFLAAPASRFMTGQIIVADGGVTAV